jgi:hypothetical protein
LRRVALIHWLVALVEMELIDRDELLDRVEEDLGSDDSEGESDFGGLSPGCLVSCYKSFHTEHILILRAGLDAQSD